jgi:hypothetical protein
MRIKNHTSVMKHSNTYQAMQDMFMSEFLCAVINSPLLLWHVGL